MDLGGYHVPKGTAVLTAQYSFHHNPDYWPEPEKFQPERRARSLQSSISEIKAFKNLPKRWLLWGTIVGCCCGAPACGCAAHSRPCRHTAGSSMPYLLAVIADICGRQSRSRAAASLTA